MRFEGATQMTGKANEGIHEAMGVGGLCKLEKTRKWILPRAHGRNAALQIHFRHLVSGTVRE
jgi:hypothetical protein